MGMILWGRWRIFEYQNEMDGRRWIWIKQPTHAVGC
jgi:hypothetical protein